MTGTLLATTPKADVHALAFGGIMVYTCFPQIRDMLRRKFGDDYVLLFAEPEENKQTSEIDWYTPVYGTPRKLEDLPDEQRESIAEKITSMAKDIQDFAEELMRSPDQMKVTRGNILRLALCYPDNSYIYVSGDQPVFVCWGFGPGTPGVEPKDLTRLWAKKIVRPAPVPEPETAPGHDPEPIPEPAPKAEPVVTPVPVARNWGCLWWLLPFFLLPLLLWLLFTSFGGLPAIAGKSFFQGPALSFLEEPGSRASDIAALRTEIDSLQAQLDKHIALCLPEAPKAAVTPPATPPAIVDEGESLVIPDKSEDTRFLEGEWLCRTGLANASTGNPVEVIFNYDSQGRGKATVFDRSDRCVGDATAELKDGELVMAVEAMMCDRPGKYFSPVKIICKNTDGSAADCAGVNQDGSTWRANFIKVK